jgi:uncharacterized protein YgbK (DUF1537 family)
MTTTPACRGGKTTAAAPTGDRRSPGHMKRTPSETMDTMIGHLAANHVDRFEGLMTGGGATTIGAVRPSGLTSRDIEAEILVRLARRGHDWAGTPGRRRGAP